jgi:galactokinase
MVHKKIGVTIAVIYICVVLMTAIYAAQPADIQSTNVTANQTVVVNETNVYNNFSAIAETPYNERTNNCTTKAKKLADYLVSQGESPSLITINNRDGTTAHMAVVWRSEIYDPTMKPASYGQPMELYLQGLVDLGYNGLTTIEPYTG